MNNQEYKLEIKELKNLLKSLTAMNGLDLVKVKNKVNEKYKRADSIHNLRRKLNDKKLHVSEMLEILDILNCEVIIKYKK